MYRVYVLKQRRGKGSEVLIQTRTQTPVFAAAAAAFWVLYDGPYDEHHLLLMTHENRQINAHRFGSKPGDRDHIARGQDLASS